MRAELDVKFTENMKAICKHKKIKIGEIEKSIDKQAGYFARESCAIRLSDAYKISRELGVSLEELIEEDWPKRIKRKNIEIKIKAMKRQLEMLEIELEAEQ